MTSWAMARRLSTSSASAGACGISSNVALNVDVRDVAPPAHRFQRKPLSFFSSGTLTTIS